MSFPFKSVIFDWAWTLVDLGSEDDRAAFQALTAALQSKGFIVKNPEDTYAACQTLFHEQIAQSRKSCLEAHFSLVLDYLLLQRGWELTPTEKKDLLSIYYKELFRQRRVYPDVEPTLQALRKEGVRMGIVSNTTNPPFMKDYERGILGLDLFFDWTIYSSQVPFRKPHPSIFRLAIDRMGCAPADILFVGDNLKADILGAQAVGMAGAWLNRDREPVPPGAVPEFEIFEITDVLGLRSPRVEPAPRLNA